MNLKDLAVYARPEDSLNKVIESLSRLSTQVKHPGLVLVVNKENKLLGVFTDGDFRKAYSANIDFKSLISEFMTKQPITFEDTLSREELIKAINITIRESKRQKGWTRNIILLNKHGEVVNVIDFTELINDHQQIKYNIKIFGLGYVGITLAVSLAGKGNTVKGIDINQKLINQLNKGEPHVFEPGLSDLLNSSLKSGNISFSTSNNSNKSEIYIIAVGTPLNKFDKPELKALKNATNAIGKHLKNGDLVMLRSTVPPGTTRDVVIPILEELSSLKAGKDFFIAFTPERTIEGNAMKELKTLPQVIGGLTINCTRKASVFWSILTKSVVQLSSLEAAELVKLANNTYRDLSFAFANELALISDKFNINSFDLIHAANEGYPRNKIPFPSPGVGGYCLSKDPILYGCDPTGKSCVKTLGNIGRDVNIRASMYPIKVIERYSKIIKKDIKDFSILLIGIAFKGEPETSDIRGSVAVEIYNKLVPIARNVMTWDAVIDFKSLSSYGLNPIESIESNLDNVDAILILNNNHKNINWKSFLTSKNNRLIFDGWNLLEADEIEKIDCQSYATMGYITKD